MRRLFYILILAFLPMLAMAQHELKSHDYQSQQTVELRQEITFSYDLTKQLNLSLNEEIREAVYDRLYDLQGVLLAEPGAHFSKSYTTVEFAYRPVHVQSLRSGYKYNLRLSAGYTLRLRGEKDLSDASKCLQHRPHLTLQGSVDFGLVKLSIRERYQVDIRLDSVSVVDRWNPALVVLEKNPYKMELRSRLRADFTIPGKPLKPYTYVELTNTLNEPSCPWEDSSGKPLYGGQYLNGVRAVGGLKWRIDSHNSLTFYYGYYWSHDRKVNITKSVQNVELTELQGHKHVIGISYDLGY